MKQKIYHKSLSLAAGVLMLASVAWTAPLVPAAGPSVPDIFSSAGWTLLATTGPTVLSAPTFSGVGQAWVYSDTNNVFGPGKLDFVYSYTSNASSSDPNERLTAGTFSGFSVDSGYVPGAGLAPDSVSLSSGGSVAGFQFIVNNLMPGHSTDLLVVETNATLYAPGTYSVQDSTTVSTAGFQPLLATPEPASLALIGAGLLGFSLIRRRSSNK